MPKRLDSKQVYHCPLFAIEQQRMLDESGAFDVYCLKTGDWVTVVARTKASQFVFIRQHRFGIGAITLETPGGRIDVGESPAEAGVRELREETGFLGDPPVSLGWAFPNPAFQNNRIHFVLIDNAALSVEKQLDEHEVTEVVLVEMAKVHTKMKEGEINHALSCLALHRAFARGRGSLTDVTAKDADNLIGG